MENNEHDPIKSEYQKAFNAGKKYWSDMMTDEPMLYKPIDFNEWYLSTNSIELNKAKFELERLREKEIRGDRRLVELEHDKTVLKAELTELKEKHKRDVKSFRGYLLTRQFFYGKSNVSAHYIFETIIQEYYKQIHERE